MLYLLRLRINGCMANRDRYTIDAEVLCTGVQTVEEEAGVTCKKNTVDFDRDGEDKWYTSNTNWKRDAVHWIPLVEPAASTRGGRDRLQ